MSRLAPGARRWRWLLLAAAAAVAVAAVAAASAYQPLATWNGVGGFPGLARPTQVREVNTFGGMPGEIYIPPQRGAFAMPVSLGNFGPYPVTIEAVSMTPPGTDDPQPLLPAGRVLYWTPAMYGGLHPKAGRPIAGLSLKPGLEGVYIGVPVRTSSCYITTGFAVPDSFYVKERFLWLTKWVKIPLDEPFLLHAPAAPPNQPGPGTICPGR